MKLDVIVIDLKITRKTKRIALVAGTLVALVLGSGALVFANVKHTFASGDPLSAAAINDNFSDIDLRLNTLEGLAKTPTGGVAAFGGSVASVPSGWLLCDGSAVSRTAPATAALFGVVGIAHGAGDLTTTFNLPDYRGRFLRGTDNGAGRDPNRATRTAAGTGGNAGDLVGSIEGQATKLPTAPFGADTAGDHSHSFVGGPMAFGSTTPNTGGNFGGGGTPFNPLQLINAGAHTHTISGGDSETRPINAGVNYIIKL